MSNNYTIPQYGPNGPFEVGAGQVDTTLSLKLLGRGAPGYGQVVAENTVRQLSNFAGPTSPTGTLLQGQLWFDTSVSTLKVYSGNAWRVVFGESNATTTPLSVSQGGTGLSITSANGNQLLQVKSDGSGFNLVTPQQLANTVQPHLPFVNVNTGIVPNGMGVANKFLQVTADGMAYKFVTASEMAGNLTGNLPYLRSDTNAFPTSDNTYTLGGPTKQFASVYATNFMGTATSAKYADLAERYETSEAVEAGDVVMMGGDKEICKAVGEKCADVLGVVSTAPAFKMNSDAGADETHPYVALAGRVPVKVIGPVRKGQRLVQSNTPGVAMAAENSAITSMFQVIGRSLVDKTSNEVELIEAVVGAK